MCDEATSTAADNLSISLFKSGDLIWAKMKGFPPWPAKVLEPSEETPARRIPVMFFGTLEKSFMKVADLSDYLKNRQIYEVPRKQKDFNKAIHEIRQAAGLEKDEYVEKAFPTNDLDKKLPSSPQGRIRTISHSQRCLEILNHPDDNGKRKRSNSASTRSRSRASSSAGVLKQLREMARKEQRRRLDSESSGGSRRNNKMISGIGPEMIDFGQDELTNLLGDDFFGGTFSGLREENRTKRTKRSRASSRLFEDYFSTAFGHRQRNRSGSTSGHRSRMLSMSGGDVFEELMNGPPGDLEEHAHQLMMTLNNLPSEGSVDRPISPELVPTLPPPLQFCNTCGHECKLFKGVWKCTGKSCSRYKEAAEANLHGFESLHLPQIKVEPMDTGDDDDVVKSIDSRSAINAKQDVMSPSRSSLRINRVKKETSPVEEDRDTSSSHRASRNGVRKADKRRQRVQVMSPKRSATREISPLSPRRTIRPKTYKVEKTPPISSTGHRHCVFCNGQVRPQMCGGNRHRWRCVDKKCRKWYGWVRSHEEIPKNSSKYLQLKAMKQRKRDDDDPEGDRVTQEAKEYLQIKRKVGRPSKHDIKIRLRIQKEFQARQRSPSRVAESSMPLKRKYTKRKKDEGGVAESQEEEKKRPLSPLTTKQMRYRPSAMEKRARWWTGEKRRVDVSPEREFSTTPADSAAAFRLMAHAVRSAAVTRADEVGTVNGTLDLLMDSLLGSMAPLLSLFQKLPGVQLEPQVTSELWNASSIHIPTFQ